MIEGQDQRSEFKLTGGDTFILNCQRAAPNVHVIKVVTVVSEWGFFWCMSRLHGICTQWWSAVCDLLVTVGVVVILCLCSSNTWGQRHYVFGLSVCLSIHVCVHGWNIFHWLANNFYLIVPNDF